MAAVFLAINFIVLATLAIATWYWRPAGFAFILVLPLALLGFRSMFSGGVSARTIFIATGCLLATAVAGFSYFWAPAVWGYLAIGPLVVLGAVDMLQSKQAIRRNFPVIGHARYVLEAIRPELQQYFVERDIDGRPFHREDRSLVYQRAKGERDTVPFGTQRNVYEVGYEWINHSLAPVPGCTPPPRITIGEGVCKQPYAAALLNISAMSFGALSPNAITALNRGASSGDFAHNTGEGGISPYHRNGGDLIWQIGTGYFGCRAEDGRFDEGRFAQSAGPEAVRMVEIKLSQGAKPGHGGILPAAKVTPEIASIRGVLVGEDVLSPPAHTAFTTPIGLLEFVTRLRELSGGKPVGFKLCVGKRREFLAICKAMVDTGLHPDYVAVDGGEGGTGAAPPEFANSLGCPLTEGLIFVHNSLVGVGYRDRVRVIASGKVASGFALVKQLALGADLCYSARAMMMALGCIQARRCNSNQCPVGIATQNPALGVGLVVAQKERRVARYQEETVRAALELMAAAGIVAPGELRPWHIMRRISPLETRHYGELTEYLETGALLREPPPAGFARAWEAATADSFAHRGESAAT